MIIVVGLVLFIVRCCCYFLQMIAGDAGKVVLIIVTCCAVAACEDLVVLIGEVDNVLLLCSCYELMKYLYFHVVNVRNVKMTIF